MLQLLELLPARKVPLLGWLLVVFWDLSVQQWADLLVERSVIWLAQKSEKRLSKACKKLGMLRKKQLHLSQLPYALLPVR